MNDMLRDPFRDVGKKLDLIIDVLREKQQRSNGSQPAAPAEESAPDSEQPERKPRTLTYVPVVTTARAAEVVHAAITRRVNNRNRVEKSTLCDRNGKRIVDRVLHGEDLDATVTCKQCRDQLVEDGMIDP